MSDYPPYACSCCGFTNGDMFYDYNQNPTEVELAEFSGYRKAWYSLKEAREALLWEQRKLVNIKSRHHSEETKRKISVTKRAKKEVTP